MLLFDRKVKSDNYKGGIPAMQQKTGKLRTRFRQNRPAKFIRVIFWITLLMFVSSIVSIWLNDDQQVKSRMVFNAVSCFFMLVLLVLPVFVKKFFNIRIPHVILVIYVIFAFSGIILGDVINFFDKFKYWDSLLHFSSGILLASLGFILINTLNKADSVSLRLSPIFVSVSVFCFALALGAIWEIIEYACDDLFGTSMQTFLSSTGGSVADENAVYLVGHEALKDTMWDLILDAGGALIIAVYGYIQLIHEKKGLATGAFEKEETPEGTKPAPNAAAAEAEPDKTNP